MTMTDATTTTGQTGVGNSYDLAKVISLDLGFPVRTSRFIGHVSIISVFCSSISVSPRPTSITIKLCRDPEGDECIVTSTAGMLEIGMTTTSKGSAVFIVGGIITLPLRDTVYLFAKTNDGTIDIDELRISWSLDVK